MQEFLAREYENNKQTLKEHLTNVSDLASEFSKYKSISKLTGLLHDVGKASSEFQTYLLSKNHKRGDVVHALQGTFYLDSIIGGSDDLASMMLKEILSLSITAHHGSLSDGISPDGEKVFLHKLKNKNDERYHYSEIEQNIKENLEEVIAEINHLIESANKEIDTILDLLKRTYNTGKSAQFAMGLFVKYIYSCLIDADRYDAYLFEIDKKAESTKPNWENFINIFEENINKYNNDTQIAKIRQSISNQCKDAANKNSGIYRLSVSTGGGKTLSSFRFALHHCKEKKKSRIIYVIPYLSIIEQTASELHKILNLDEENDFILEHHSGIVPSDDSEEQKIKKLAASRWNNPLIITTMVQFLETIMSAKGSKLRKFHHMSDSVIIFDEIQSLPVKTIHLFNEAVSFLAKVCNSTILLCTATQPQLHKTEKNNLLLESDSNLIDCDHLFADIKRTIIKKETDRNADDFSDFIIDKANVNGNCLAIVNTKKSAKEVYDRVKRQQDFAVYHLSTSMCSVHRTLILNKIKDDLKHQRKIICITTPLIEAGVDVSFACVIRATAGLDSVAQAAGRCNRNGESDEPKEVYVVSLTDENLTKLADIEAGKNITERVIREFKNEDLLSSKVMEQFYKYYFYDRKHLMNYKLKDDETIYDLLSLNKSGRRNHKNKFGKECNSLIAHAFSTASDEFYLIEKNTEPVVVEYLEAESLIDEYRRYPKSIMNKEKSDIIRKLDKYSVSLYPYEMKRLTDIGAINFLDDEIGIKILSSIYYQEDVGVVFEADINNYIS